MLCQRSLRVYQQCDVGHFRQNVAQQLNTLASKAVPMKVAPVTFAPGRFMLSTRPSATGSPPYAKTIGIFDVAPLPRAPGRVTRGSLHKTLREAIEATAVRVF